MSLSSPVRNTVFPLRIQERLNQMFARATGFSGPQVLDFLRRAPKKGGTTSRERHGQFPEVPSFALYGEPALNTSAIDRGCVKTPTARVLGSCKMSPEVSIVDCGLFCAIGLSRTIDKIRVFTQPGPKTDIRK